ncbi:MAG: hypothetical protein FGM44_02845 [Limnohabitans sp.]|jgi:hypothetical protein|nr:hypothetical protein [Limnohabitans sp.]
MMRVKRKLAHHLGAKNPVSSLGDEKKQVLVSASLQALLFESFGICFWWIFASGTFPVEPEAALA